MSFPAAQALAAFTSSSATSGNGRLRRWRTVADPTLHVSESVMCVRGGAFDTYFENQATCHFQSGEQALARRRNIGFRLAIPMSDLEAPPEADVQNATGRKRRNSDESTAELLVATQ